jgi:hypothetical protein
MAHRFDGLLKCWTCGILYLFWQCHRYQQLFKSPASEDARHQSLQETMMKSSFASISTFLFHFLISQLTVLLGHTSDMKHMKWAQTTLIIIWAPGKFFFVHILFFFIQLTSFALFTGF